MNMQNARARFVNAAWPAAVSVCCLLFAGAASAGDWITDASTDCRVWNPHPRPTETMKWSGSCLNGLAQGHGSAQWFRDNLPFETDEGDWKDGRQAGRGTQVWPSGRYEGELLDGEPHGRGVLTLGSTRYDGEFRGGRPDGAGTLTNSGGVYQGHWTNGCFRDGRRRASLGVPLSSCP